MKMRSVIFEASISLDGFIEGPNGEMDWLVHDADSVLDNERFVDAFDTMFFGRKAYERIAIPQLPVALMSDAEREFYYMLHGMRKYVFSRREKHVVGNGMVISGNIEQEVSRIRDEDGKDILFCGGAEILRTFTALDLIDEYVLTVHPVMLYSGKSLFTGNRTPPDLALVHKQRLNSGILMLHYKPESRITGMTYGSGSI